MRANTNQERLTDFMSKFAKNVRGPGQLYFTGGATAVLMGWREMTVDIDLLGDPEPLGFFESISKIKDALDINIELASPPDFIPLLPGWQDRSIFIKKVGFVEYFHYDLYSQALSKISRFHERDQGDVNCMMAAGLVAKSKLRQLYNEIEPRLIRYPKINIARFSERVALLTAEEHDD